jgi:hypothetical protein
MILTDLIVTILVAQRVSVLNVLTASDYSEAEAGSTDIHPTLGLEQL